MLTTPAPRRFLATSFLALLALVGRAEAGFPLSNDASPLAVCQDSIRTAALRLATDARRTLSACFTGGVECVLADPLPGDGCCAKAERRCRSQLARLAKAERRFGVFLANRRCGELPFADVVASDGLGYDRLAERCAALVPPGSVDDLAGLADCLARLIVADTACDVGTRDLPRSPDALACLGLLPAPRTVAGTIDLASCDTAPEPTATPSGDPSPSGTVTPGPPTTTPSAAPTVAATMMPTATRTTTPVPSATGTPVATATRTMTPVPSATGTPVATATRTATPVPSATSTPVGTATGTAPQPTASAPATVTPTPLPTVTPTRTATPVATTTPSGPQCGNGVVETGEDCDDGNTFNCDGCPKNCRTSTAPVACSATTVRHVQRIQLNAPAGALLSGFIACIDYPAGVVALPGTGNVAGRTSGVSGLVTLNDFDNAAQITVVGSPPGAAQVNPQISFDLCTGATAPLPAAFSCALKGASNQGTAIDPPSLVACVPVAAP